MARTRPPGLPMTGMRPIFELVELPHAAATSKSVIATAGRVVRLQVLITKPDPFGVLRVWLYACVAHRSMFSPDSGLTCEVLRSDFRSADRP